MPRVLIAVPDAALREALVRCVAEAGWDAEAAGDVDPLEVRRQAVVILDVAGAAGVRQVEALARAGAVVVALGAAEPRRLAIDALRAGAREFLCKPFELRTLERALAAAEHALRRPAVDARMARLVRDAESAARSDATLQILGESGTGRHRLARFVHVASGRRDAPFVEFATESHDTGAAPLPFDVAFENAAGGTLLVEEPGLLPPLAQAELMDAFAHDVAKARLILISRRRLREDPRLRADLRLRLDVLLLRVPPLRERPADVELLARDFAAKAALARGVEPPRLAPSAIAALCALPLPGNATELESLMERATALFSGRDLDVAALLCGRAEPASADDPAESLDLGVLERAAIERALLRCRGNRTHAARALGISVRTLRNKLREYADVAPELAEAVS